MAKLSTDPRGPLRTVVSAEARTNGNFIVCACGHTTVHAPHFAAPKPGTEVRCFACRGTTI